MKSESIKNLALALSRAQAEMPVVNMDSQNPFLKYNYATLGAIINAVRPILSKYELSVTQFPVNDGNQVGVTSILIHSSGEWIEESIAIPIGEQKGLTTAQNAGVAITYLRRYALASILGVYADEDTDARLEHGDELPPIQVERRPVPERKPKPTANEVQKLRSEFGKLYNKANQMGLKDLPVISRKMNEKELLEQIAEINVMIGDQEKNNVPED